MIEGEILSVFLAEFFPETVPPHFAVFQSSVCLRFFVGGFFVTNFGMGVRGFSGSFFGLKMPFLRPKNGVKKFSLS